MPVFLEARLKAKYGAKNKIPYMIMNRIGAMHGNRETAKGREMQRKHDEDVRSGSLRKLADAGRRKKS